MDALWHFTDDVAPPPGESLTGYRVAAPDGTVGTVDRWVDEPGRAHLVADTGMWVFGRSVLIPAGIVGRVDPATRTVTVLRTRNQIGDAPGFTTDRDTADPAYLAEVGAYYARLGANPA